MVRECGIQDSKVFVMLLSIMNIYLRGNTTFEYNALKFFFTISCSLMNSNNIAQLVKTHFTNCPLTGEVSFGSHDIGWIEPGSIWAVFDSR